MSEATLTSLARRLVVGLAGCWPTAREEAWLGRWRPGGVILFSRNVTGAEQLATLCSHLHRLVPGLEIVADHEGGPVSQLAAAVGRPPAAWALGVLDDSDLTRRVHVETGRRCRRLGVDRLLAPCADVLTEIHNPVIGSRAFGSDEDLVARQVAGAVQGLTEAGMDTCLKHWPGHGGSRSDSHLTVSSVGNGAVAGPFLKGLAAGSAAVMVGHLRPRSTEGSGLPATMDADLLQRDRKILMAAMGLALTFYADDVTMGALRSAMVSLGCTDPGNSHSGMMEPGDLSLSWLLSLAEAGCDRLLIRGIPWRAFEGAKSDLVPGFGSDTVPEWRPPVDDAGKDLSAEAEAYGEVHGEAYQEARRRLRVASGLDAFASNESDLVWLDFTAGDRWEVAAAGPESGQCGNLGTRLREDFGNVRHLDGRVVKDLEGIWGCELGKENMTFPRIDRLLITSHRPLIPDYGYRPELPDLVCRCLTEQGVCLVMGHPSLAQDVGSWLPDRWSISALFDITSEDYG
ncbi:MAG: hypothetical protein KOO60_08000 [Gemmatimonadales bacterium]|nr:hypothetical protein [Gemmatimonadales bacterium]